MIISLLPYKKIAEIIKKKSDTLKYRHFLEYPVFLISFHTQEWGNNTEKVTFCEKRNSWSMILDLPTIGMVFP